MIRESARWQISKVLCMERVYGRLFSSSDYYDVSKLRVPFLHIYGKYLGMRDVSFDEFYRTKIFAPVSFTAEPVRGLHHWDVATEGRASAMVLHNRGQLERGVKASFELANIYLLNFFNAVVEKRTKCTKDPGYKNHALPATMIRCGAIRQYPALKPPPDKLQFEELIKRKGIDEAIELARDFRKVDSTADFISENGLNHLAQILQEKNNLKDGIKLMHRPPNFILTRRGCGSISESCRKQMVTSTVPYRVVKR